MTLVVKIPLCLEMIRFLSSLSNNELESSLSSPPPSQLHLLTKAWKYLTWDNSTFHEFEFVFLLSDSLTLFPKSWGQFKALNVLSWMVSEKPRVGFPSALWKVSVPQYRLCRHLRSRPSMLPFSPISKSSWRYPKVSGNETVSERPV